MNFFYELIKLVQLSSTIKIIIQIGSNGKQLLDMQVWGNSIEQSGISKLLKYIIYFLMNK